MASIDLGSTVNSNGFSHKSGAVPTTLIGTVRSTINNVKDFLKNGSDKIADLSGLSSSAKIQNNSFAGYYPASSGKAAIDYFSAPLSERYGMSAQTAYQEALANTAHQREVQDLKAAGLNPVLSANGGNGAAVFGGAQLASGGGSSGGSSAGSSQLTAKGILKDYNARSAIAALGSAAVTSMTGNFSLGAAAYYGTNAALNALAKK